MRAMPFYEYQCAKCGAKAEVFVRSVNTAANVPACPDAGRQTGHEMRRILSPFIRHMTEMDKLTEAEAKFGKEVDAALGPSPDVGKLARRYEKLTQDLPEEA